MGMYDVMIIAKGLRSLALKKKKKKKGRRLNYIWI